MRQQAFAIALVLDLLCVLNQVVERAVLRDQLARTLVADAGHAFDVIDGVAHQRHDIDHLVGGDAELLLDPGGVVPRAFVARIEHADAVAHQLEKILVEGDDHRLETGAGRLHRQRTDDIVGFIPIGRNDRDAERLARRVDHRDLDCELIRHRRAIRLVVAGEIVAKRAPGQIERRGNVLRLVLVQQLAQHGHEDVHGVGRLSLRIAQQAAVGRAHRRVIGAVHLRAAVDEIDDRSGCHQSGDSTTINAELAEPAESIHMGLRVLRFLR